MIDIHYPPHAVLKNEQVLKREKQGYKIKSNREKYRERQQSKNESRHRKNIKGADVKPGDIIKAEVAEEDIVRRTMRILFLCEISHHISDLTPEVLIVVRDEIGYKQFEQLQKKSDEFWDKLEKEIDRKKFDYKKVRIYQDGWPGLEPYKREMKEIYENIRSSVSSDNEALEKLKEKDEKEDRNSQLMMDSLRGVISDKEATIGIIKRIADSGSRNYQLLKKLLEEGATLEASEDYNLLTEERNYILRIKDAKSDEEKALAKKEYEKRKAGLLKERDMHFADRINKTLREGEVGLAFIGKKHDISPYLDKDIMKLRVFLS